VLSGSVVFSLGQQTRTLTVWVNGDTTPEPNETFFVHLTSAMGATIIRTQGIGTILDDDTMRNALL
jgi:large repetitive protein